MKVETLIENLMFSTVRMTTTDSDGQTSQGTGFFYHRIDGPAGYLFLVTNRHVVEDASPIQLHCISKGTDGAPQLDGKEQPIIIGDGAAAFTMHPDPDVDLAMMNIGPLLDAIENAGSPIFYRSVGDDLCATDATLDEFEPIEPVTFIGYPDGLYDSHTLLPIVRRGHSASALSVDYEGKPTFLIDASVFPGSSGSPVFLTVPPGAPDKYGTITLGGGPRCVFLGVVAAVYERAVPVLTASAFFVEDAIDIGIVYKARAVRELSRELAP